MQDSAQDGVRGPPDRDRIAALQPHLLHDRLRQAEDLGDVLHGSLGALPVCLKGLTEGAPLP